MTNQVNQEALLSDEQIEYAFKNTNFGSNDYRAILLKGLRSTALGYHNGWTLTQIIRTLNLGEPKDIDSNKLNERGLRFIEQAATKASESEINSLKERVAELDAELFVLQELRKNQATLGLELTASNNQLREALEEVKKWFDSNIELAQSNEYGDLEPANSYSYECYQFVCFINQAISSTTTQSLVERDNEVIERIATALENAEGEFKTLPEYVALVRAMKND